MSGAGAGRVAVGLQARRLFDVLDRDTASAVGSGSVPSLSTPRLLAWLEAATVAALDPALAATETSVGTRVELDHLQASPVGERICVEAVVAAVEGRRVDLDVEASGGDGALVGRGRITRMVVDRERFVQRLGPVDPGCAPPASVG